MNTQKVAIREYPDGRILDICDTWEEAREAIQAWE